MALTDQSGIDDGASDVAYSPLALSPVANTADASRPSLPNRVTDRLLALASQIEPDAARRARWWTEDGIEALGGLTAAELVYQGGNDKLEAFLKDILDGSRG